MQRIKDLLLVLAVIALVVQALAFSGATSAVASDMQPLLAKIVNTPDQPVPVTGNVSGNMSVSGDVHVANDTSHPVPVAGNLSGNVRVTNDATNPVPVTQDQDWNVNTTPTIARKHFTDYFEMGATDGHTIQLPEPINASLIVISAQNDNYDVLFNNDGVTWMEWGGGSDSMPNLVTIPLTQRIPVDSLRFDCLNYVESCQMTVNIVGS